MSHETRWVILGKGGHAKVLADLLRRQGVTPVLTEHDDDVLPEDLLVVGMGDLLTRTIIFAKFGLLRFPSLVHRTACLSEEAVIGAGVQIMAGAIVQAGARIGDNVLVNTGAQIDHDSWIGAHSHIAPGAVICGGVEIGEGTFIGAGAVVPHKVKVPPGSFVKAGSVAS